MSLSPVYSQMFADKFKSDYQAVGKLRGSVLELHGLRGDAYKSKVIEQASMDKHGAFGADIPAKAPSVDAPLMTFENYELKLVIDNFEDLDINTSILNGYSMTHAKAIGRREDQFIIDSVVANAVKEVPVAGTNLTKDKLIQSRKLLGDDEVDENLHIVIQQSQLASLLSDPEITSTDYNSVRLLMTGEIDTFMGYKFHVLGNRAEEGGLPKTGDDRTCIAYAMEAVELGFRKDPTVSMTTVEENFRVETLSVMSAGALVNRPKGTVKIICNEAA